MTKIKKVFLILSLIFISVFFIGCRAMEYNSPRRTRRRQNTVKKDLGHLSDDIDWLLGLDRPSRLYDQSLR